MCVKLSLFKISILNLFRKCVLDLKLCKKALNCIERKVVFNVNNELIAKGSSSKKLVYTCFIICISVAEEMSSAKVRFPILN